MNIDGHTKPRIVPKVLLQVSIRELYNSLFIDPVYGGIKYSRDAENNIIITDSTLCLLLPPQLKKYHQDTRLCVVVNVVYLPKV